MPEHKEYVPVIASIVAYEASLQNSVYFASHPHRHRTADKNIKIRFNVEDILVNLAYR